MVTNLKVYSHRNSPASQAGLVVPVDPWLRAFRRRLAHPSPPVDLPGRVHQSHQWHPVFVCVLHVFVHKRKTWKNDAAGDQEINHISGRIMYRTDVYVYVYIYVSSCDCNCVFLCVYLCQCLCVSLSTARGIYIELYKLFKFRCRARGCGRFT